MKTLCIQIQSDKANNINKERICTICKGISLNKDLISHFEIQESEENEAFLNLLFETNELQKLWHQIQSDLFDDSIVGTHLSQSSIVVCEGEIGWNDYLLLYHFNKSENLGYLS